MLGISDIEQGLREIARMGAGKPHLLVGGIALYKYGSTRLTADLDIVVDAPWPELPVHSRLQFGGYISATPSGVPVDVIIRNDAFRALYEAALWAPNFLPDVAVPVVSLEFAFAMKMAAGRPKDTADLDTILDLGVDREKARQVVAQFLGPYALSDFDQTVMLADWRKSQSRATEVPI